MRSREAFNRQLETANSQNQEIQSGDISIDQTPVKEVEIPAYGISAIPLGMMLVAWVVLFLRGLLSQKGGRNYRVPHFRHQSIPCNNCRFLNQNSYLRCAVHPLTVLKKDAIGCPDFWSKDSDQFAEQVKKRQ